MRSLLTGAAMLAALSGAAHADVTVYVGYADTFRPSGFMPSPWCSSFGPLCQVQQGVEVDAGAVRIDNTGATPESIANLTVTLNGGAQVFTLWSPVTLAPGETGIFSQTTQYDFDTSDFGFLPPGIGFAINGLGGCSTPSALDAAQQAACDANTPTVSFSLDGAPVSLTDSGYVLSTGGYDLALLDANESVGWHPIGSVVTDRNNVVPEPASLAVLGFGLAALGMMRTRRTARVRA